MSDVPNWDTLRSILTAFAAESVPIIDRVEFHYDELDVRDGSGAICQTIHEPTGATIEIRVS